MNIHSTIFEAVINFLKEDEWSFSQIQIEKEPVLVLEFEGESGQWMCYATVKEDQEQIIFYSELPVKAPNNKWQRVVEFLTRANYGLTIGNFEMDLDSGKILYKTSIDIEGNGPNSALIKSLVYANISTTDKYLPGIMSVIYTDVSPTEAIAQIENIARTPIQ